MKTPVELVYATLTAKARSYWTCDICQAVAQGSPVTIKSTELHHRAHDMAELFLGIQRVPPHRMPVGWSLRFPNTLTCPNCESKE